MVFDFAYTSFKEDVRSKEEKPHDGAFPSSVV